MVIFHSYVSLPEGNFHIILIKPYFHLFFFPPKRLGLDDVVETAGARGFLQLRPPEHEAHVAPTQHGI